MLPSVASTITHYTSLTIIISDVLVALIKLLFFVIDTFLHILKYVVILN